MEMVGGRSAWNLVTESASSGSCTDAQYTMQNATDSTYTVIARTQLRKHAGEDRHGARLRATLLLQLLLLLLLLLLHRRCYAGKTWSQGNSESEMWARVVRSSALSRCNNSTSSANCSPKSPNADARPERGTVNTVATLGRLRRGRTARTAAALPLTASPCRPAPIVRITEEF